LAFLAALRKATALAGVLGVVDVEVDKA